MNNPMQNSNLLRSPGNGPPIAKKQRGGATPGSIKSRSRGPPMRRASGPPPMRSSGPPPGEVVDDAIARRRAELRRLQEKARGAMGSTSAASSKKPASSLVRSKGSGPPPPQGVSMSKVSKRTSDIFPTAPKSPSMIPKPTAKSNKESMAMKVGPPLAPAVTTTTAAKVNPNLPPETPQNNAIPPTPAVGRRLEFPSSQKAAAATKKPPPVPSSSSISRSHPNSPTKAVSSSFSSEPTTTTAIPKEKTAPPRAKSAPPRRPPGPPPAAPSDKSDKSMKVKAKKKVKARSNRPAPVRPNTLSLLPTVKTKSPKSEASSPEKKESASKSESESQPPIVEQTAPPAAAASLKPPPTASSGPPISTGPPIADTTIGKGSLDTSKLTETQTPTGQKSIAPSGNGADTPPSSGSSARRQKLHLMRQQALVASSLKSDKPPPPTAAAPASASSKPPTKMSFYTGSTGEPATAAFAKAIAPTTTTTTTTMTPPVIPNLNVRPDDNNNKKPPMQSAAQARLEDAYKKSEQEKMRALLKIKELEDKLSQSAKEQLAKSKQEHKQQKLDVQTLLSLAETQGPEAALMWAKNNSDGSVLPTSPSKPASRTGFDTGMGATPRKLPGTSLTMQPTPHRRARMAIRALQARPQNQPPELQQESPEATERRLIRQFKEAVRFVSYEFSSELATYIVRRPYGIPTNPQGLFDHCRPPTEKPEAYQKRAHVSDKTTIEVAAIVKADNTPLLVFGVAGIRYQTNANRRNVPPEWKHFEDVDAEDRPLGHVTYIDGQANEKEYSLDEILEEALLVREQYCGTLTSTALALPDLKQQQQQQQQQQPPPAQKEEPKPQQPQKQPQKPPQQQQQQPQQPPPDSDIDSGSSDVLVVFLGMVVSFVFNLIYGIFIGTPLKIVRTCFVLVVASVLLQTLHLYLADGYNEWALREFASNASSSTCSSVLASDLSWFSNQHPGIL